MTVVNCDVPYKETLLKKYFLDFTSIGTKIREMLDPRHPCKSGNPEYRRPIVLSLPLRSETREFKTA